MLRFFPSYGQLFTKTCQCMAVILVITFLPGLPPDLEFTQYTLLPPKYEGPLKVNGKLNNVEKLFENKLKGPEHFVVYNNELYTSCHGGLIYKVSNDKLIPVLKTGKECAGFFQEHICGRPLGFTFDKSGLLYVADCYYGLLRANITTGKTDTLVSMDQEIDGKPPMLPNSLVVTNNIIYWTDSSTSHYLHDGVFISLGNGNGRVLKYIISEKRNEVLINNAHFPNGIVITSDGNYLIIAETSKARLLRHYLKGPKSGTTDVFIDNLPGYPDNLINDGENIIVSLIWPISFERYLAPAPLLRKFITRSLTLVEYAFKVVNYFYSHHTIEKIIHWIGHFEMVSDLEKKPAITLIVANNGTILDSLHCVDGSTSSISVLTRFNKYYYLGSPFNPYIGRVKIV